MSEMRTTTAVGSRWPTALLLAFGPVASMVTLVSLYSPTHEVLGSAPLWMWVVLVLVAWSPLPFSIPAVVLEKDRDEAMPDMRGLGRVLRAVLLIPYMVTVSPARGVFIASLLGWVLAGAAALPWL